MTTIPPLPPADLDHRFRYHPPTPEQPAVYELLRDLAHQLALVVSAVTAPSREQSLALTKLEEAVMHANSAVARHGLTDDGTAPPVTILQGATDVLRATKPDSAVVAYCPAGWHGEGREPDALASTTEWGVFRLDTGEQVGVGTTDRRQTAMDDAAAWAIDGFDVQLRTRNAGPWVVEA